MARTPTIKIEVVDGILSEFQAGAIINSTNRNLKLRFGKLSKEILNKAGSEIQTECTKKYPKGIALGDIAVTKGFRLKCKHVYHAALPGWNSPEIDDVQQVLCRLVCKCLEQAHTDKLTSLAFPTLGCGFLGYPPNIAASTMLNCITMFENTHTDTSITNVYIVIFTNGGDWKLIKKVFHEELHNRDVIHTKAVTKRSVKDVLVDMKSKVPPGNKTSFSDTCMKLRVKNACKSILPCGHVCLGFKDEDVCPSCIQVSCATNEHQTAVDDCVICYTDPLQAAPIIQNEIDHPKLSDILEPMLELKADVEQKALYRIESNYTNHDEDGLYFLDDDSGDEYNVNYDDDDDEDGDDDDDDEVGDDDVNQENGDADRDGDAGKFVVIHDDEDDFDQDDQDDNPSQDPDVQAQIDRMCFYLCNKCQRPYYGGEIQCEQQLNADTRRFDPKSLLCGACSNVEGVKACEEHDDEYIEYKCQYCCSLASFFCFGTTHYCTECHDLFMGSVKEDIDCPVGPGSKPLQTSDCPLGVKHPPTGVEFSLGCGMCRVKQEKPLRELVSRTVGANVQGQKTKRKLSETVM